MIVRVNNDYGDEGAINKENGSDDESMLVASIVR